MAPTTFHNAFLKLHAARRYVHQARLKDPDVSSDASSYAGDSDLGSDRDVERGSRNLKDQRLAPLPSWYSGRRRRSGAPGTSAVGGRVECRGPRRGAGDACPNWPPVITAHALWAVLGITGPYFVIGITAPFVRFFCRGRAPSKSPLPPSPKIAPCPTRPHYRS